LESGVGDIVKGQGDRLGLQTEGLAIVAKAGKFDDVVNVITLVDKSTKHQNKVEFVS